MLLALWSAKGGSGTSVLAAACAITLARDPMGVGATCIVDLAGDQPAVFGLSADPALGLVDWLGAGPAAPTDALDRLLVDVAPGVRLLPHGGRDRPDTAALPLAESGAALAVALGDAPVPAVADCGTASDPATRAVVEVAAVSIVVLRGCYLALRRAVHNAALAATAGAVLLDEPGRTLSTKDISEVLGVPVLARVPVKPLIARSVDAGVVATRLPEPLARAASGLLERVGMRDKRKGAAA